MQIINGVFVDSFYLNKFGTFFLTHWHSDHYNGLESKWNKGLIYCSKITQKILLTKYPTLSQVTYGLMLNKTYMLMSSYGTQFKVTMFDSNHIAGSVMILFEVPDNQYILHTGDMRFNTHCLASNPGLFYFDQSIGNYQCRYELHTVFMDNTYCDPIFMFPNRSDALQMIKYIIDKNLPGSKMVYLVTDSIGKEEAFIGLSLHYNIPITLSEERMNYVKQIIKEPIRKKLFCLREEAVQRGSWIQVIGKQHIQNGLQKQNSISIKLTGWANLQSFYSLSERQYIVPYSLHSNYQQLELFVSIIKPKKLLPIINISKNNSSKFRQNIHTYENYFTSLKYIKQRGFEFFSNNYAGSCLSRNHLFHQEQNKTIKNSEQIMIKSQIISNNLNISKIKQEKHQDDGKYKKMSDTHQNIELEDELFVDQK